MTAPKPKARKPAPGPTAAEHFQKCGPFCEHVVFCPECVNVFGVCAFHAGDPSDSIRWKYSGSALLATKKGKR
jgi:hypothetical protein